MLKALQRFDRGAAVGVIDDAGIGTVQTQALDKPLIEICHEIAPVGLAAKRLNMGRQ
jgi:hypothetical protein